VFSRRRRTETPSVCCVATARYTADRCLIHGVGDGRLAVADCRSRQSPVTAVEGYTMAGAAPGNRWKTVPSVAAGMDRFRAAAGRFSRVMFQPRAAKMSACNATEVAPPARRRRPEQHQQYSATPASASARRPPTPLHNPKPPSAQFFECASLKQAKAEGWRAGEVRAAFQRQKTYGVL